MGTPSLRERGAGARLARGLLVALLLVLLLVGVYVAGPTRLPRGSGPLPSTSSAPATSPSEVDRVIEAEWVVRRYGCATPTQLVVDGIAPVLVERLRAPLLDARIAVGRWRDRIACPGR